MQWVFVLTRHLQALDRGAIVDGKTRPDFRCRAAKQCQAAASRATSRGLAGPALERNPAGAAGLVGFHVGGRVLVGGLVESIAASLLFRRRAARGHWPDCRLQAGSWSCQETD